MRQTATDWIPDSHPNAITVDIHLDNQCNAACVICGEHSSSLWQKENAKLAAKKIKIQTADAVIDRTIHDIVQNIQLDDLTYVKFFGGEPLFTDTHVKFIKQIPNPHNVVLHYTTNGSIYPNDEVLAIWKKFKTVIFAASLDGVDQQFDYVRWPLPWKKVSSNLKRLQQNADIWNIVFRVEFTANWLNTYYYQELENWVNENFHANLSGDKTEINIHSCLNPNWSPAIMPQSIRDLVMQRYPDSHVIHNLVKNLPAHVDQSEWKQFVATWDQRRGNSWAQAFPDLCKHLA